jgi:hypothetical protein
MTNIVEIKAGLEGIKMNVADLKTRATKLTTTRDSLIAREATLEQTKTQSLAELKELGITPANLQPATLELLAEQAMRDLKAAVTNLGEAVTTAEALVAGPGLSGE